MDNKLLVELVEHRQSKHCEVVRSVDFPLPHHVKEITILAMLVSVLDHVFAAVFEIDCNLSRSFQIRDRGNAIFFFGLLDKTHDVLDFWPRGSSFGNQPNFSLFIEILSFGKSSQEPVENSRVNGDIRVHVRKVIEFVNSFERLRKNTLSAFFPIVSSPLLILE